MFILSSDGTKLVNMGENAGLHCYTEPARMVENRKDAKDGETCGTILLEAPAVTCRVGVYDNAEDCKKVLEIIAFAINGGMDTNKTVVKLPTKKELAENYEEFKRFKEMQEKAAGNVKEQLNELFNELF